ncbi:MAG: hypothetical protein WDA75_18585 [Candidatus Latescibacterota bacterium]|jgi:hypothetical protein
MAILITCRPNTGSTMLWNWLRQLPGATGYYEPTLPVLRQIVRYDPAPDPAHRHYHVPSYGTEYRRLPEFDRYYRPYFGLCDLYLDGPCEEGAELAEWLGYLLSSPASHGPVVLKDLNLSLRLAWVRVLFPGVKVVYLRRSARAQWRTKLRNLRRHYGAIAGLDNFGDTSLSAYRDDLEWRFPFLGPRPAAAPYALHYLINELVDKLTRAQADAIVEYDDLVARPAPTLGALFEAVGFPAAAAGEVLRLAPVVPEAQRGSGDTPAPPGNEDAELTGSVEETEGQCRRLLAEFGLAAESVLPGEVRAIRAKNPRYVTDAVDRSKGLHRALRRVSCESFDRWGMVLEKEAMIQELARVCEERLELIERLDADLKRLQTVAAPTAEEGGNRGEDR